MLHFYSAASAQEFDGVPQPVNASLAPDLSSPGLGLDFKECDAEEYAP